MRHRRGARHGDRHSGLATGATIALAVALAFFFGYSLTAQSVWRAGFGWRQVVRIALIADTGLH